jgi:hypothetical protein
MLLGNYLGSRAAALWSAGLVVDAARICNQDNVHADYRAGTIEMASRP